MLNGGLKLNKQELIFNCTIELVNRGIPLREARVKVFDLSIDEIKNLIGVEI